MDKSQIAIPNRPKPYLVQAYNGYYGTLKEFRTIMVRLWESHSYMYNDVRLLCSIFPEHVLPTSKNGFMNEFYIKSLKECYMYSKIWEEIEFHIRNWKYCEYYIGSELVYHNELDCYIRNILKNITFQDVKVINPKIELKKLRRKWKSEKFLYNIIESIFTNHTVVYHYRSKWLEGLELDIYIEDFKIGIEYQGIQHYQVVEHWGGENGLKKRQFNDTKKMKLCIEHGIRLIYFDYTEPLTIAIQ